MGKKNFVPCLNVIMIAFYPRNSTVKDNTSFFGVSTILIASFFFCCLESLSDLFLLLIIGCTGNMSMGAFLLRDFPFIALQKERWMRMTLNRSSKFKMI